MNKERYIIAYDFGTSSVKSLIVRRDGAPVASSASAYPIYEPKKSYVEQDPKEYWDAVCEATKAVLRESLIDKDQVAAIAFSTQALGIIPMSKDREILYRNISWIDGRAEEEASFINDAIGIDIFGGKDVIPKLLWLKNNEPGIWEKTEYILHVNGYLQYKATGNITSEISGAANYGLDLETLEWPKELLDGIGVGTDKFPPLVKSTDMTGNLTEAAAAEMGLTTAVQVFGGCDDVQAAAMGSGTNSEGDAHIYLGSSAWLCYATKDAFPMKNGAATTKSADPRINVIPGVTQAACLTLDWAIDSLYGVEKRNGLDVYSLMEDAVKNVPPGSGKIISTPWLYGEYCPVKSEDVRAMIFNLSNVHHRAEIMRSILEGIGFNLRWTIENYTEDFGISIDEITIFGGGAASNTWMQAMADIFNIKIKTIKNGRYVCALGAAMCAMIGMGIVPDFESTKALVEQESSYMPNLENQEIYTELFTEYKNLYYATKDIFERLNRL